MGDSWHQSKKKSKDEDENSPPIYPERNRSHDEKKWARTSKLRKRRDSDRSCQPCTVLDFIQVELRNFAEDVILWDDLKKMLTPISVAGTETVRSGLVSIIVYFVHAVQSASIMSWFMLGMTAYPEVQRKCQEELDSVIGRSRMPTLADRDNLPYICATVREALRWRAVAPLGKSLPKMNVIADPHPCLVT